MSDSPVSRDEFDALVKKVDDNTKLTQEVKDILTTFHVMFVVAKWTTAIAVCATSIVAAWKTLRGL